MKNARLFNFLNGCISVLTFIFLISLFFPLQIQASPSADIEETPVKLPPGTDSGWWGNVQEYIKRSEYLVTWQDQSAITGLSSYQAPNRVNNIRTYFTDKGIRIVPRTGDERGWEWGLSLKGYGPEGNVRPVESAEIIPDKNRVEYRWGDNLTEWYINNEKGLEQGFTVNAPLVTQQAGQENLLILKLTIHGNLRGVINGSGDLVEFSKPVGGGVLNYSKLYAFDSSGKELSAVLRIIDSELEIQVDTAGAAYPITIDPLISASTWMVESNQESARFGHSVASAGDVNGDGYSDVIVGAPYYDNGWSIAGRTFVYHGSSTGLNTSASWTAESDQASAFFGWSVASAGDVNGDGYSDVIVGVNNYAISAVYHGSPTGLEATPSWIGESEPKYSQFGYSVASAGDVNGDGYSDIVVGAPIYTDGQSAEGRAYVYHGSPTGLEVNPSWTAESNQESAHFGGSVASAGDVNGDGYSDIVVGAQYYTDGQYMEGRAYVYHGSSTGLEVNPSWTAESDQESAYFGGSVASAGDVNGDGYSDIVVGAQYYTDGQYKEGRAYVYHGSSTGLNAAPSWTAESDQKYANFGLSVASAGDINGDGYSDIIVGAPNMGHAFVYNGSFTGLSRTAESYTGNFESSVASAGDVNGDGYSDIIVGAPSYDNGQRDEGCAYVYHGSSTGMNAVPSWTAESDQDSGSLGYSVASAGDVNRDGYSDIIVGAPFFDNGQTNEGRAFVYCGSSTGLNVVSSWTAESDQADALFGYSVASAGDVNGDGYSDIIVGAPYYDNDQSDEGRAFVYCGSSTGLNAVSTWTVESDQDDALLGYSVSSAGDMNGDGYSDVIVGAPYYYNGQENGGYAFVYNGSFSGLNAAPSWTAASDQDDALFGYSVATAGDVNGDGYSDIIVGAPFYDNDQVDEGRAFVYWGSSTGLNAVSSWTAESDQDDALFGYSVASAGDVNGDGYSDIIVGAPHYDNGQENEGHAFVYNGSFTGLNAAPAWTAASDQDDALFGSSVASAGDVNGDGYSDVIVGAPAYDKAQTGEGRAYVYRGSSIGLNTTPFWTAESNQNEALFGTSIASAGDVNGDGYSDIIVGTPYYNNDQSDEGRVFVYHGSSTSLTAAPSWTAESDNGRTRFGYSVASAGDVNGDGYSDVIVGAPYYDNGWSTAGRTFVYHGSSTGLNASPSWVAETNQSGTQFGTSVASAGDVNGDGYSDVIVGAPYYYGIYNQRKSGGAFVYHGSSTGLNAVPSWTAASDQEHARFGRCVASAGDVNGDGYSDVIVGASYYDNGQEDEGRAFVYHGSSTGLNIAHSWTAESDQAGSFLGRSVSSAGDVNGDGYSDVIVGASYYDNGQTNEGRVFVYYGSSTGLNVVPSWTEESDQEDGYFGSRVASAGDVNGDGYSDVIVDAYVYHGSPTGLNTAAFYRSDTYFVGIGASAGDVNGDGYSDVIVGDPYYDNGHEDEGRASVYHGSSTGLNTAPSWRAESDQEDAFFGWSVASAGDVNGDGYSDVIVGAYNYDNEGHVFVYYGNGGNGQDMKPRQYKVSNNSPIASLGLSNGLGTIRLGLAGHTPYGRIKAKLQWEVKPLGILLSGTGYHESTVWHDTGTIGAEINELITGLSDNTVYHWQVRFRYHPATAPLQQYSRWVSLPWNNPQEADFRTFYQDTDGDGLSDSVEMVMCTFHDDADSDDDGIIDGDEDANHDGIVNAGEIDPCDADTDSDGMPDGWEVEYGLDPLIDDADEDADDDGYSNIKEYQRKTYPNDYDSHPSGGLPWLLLLLKDDK